jgi:hypothetical protein
MLDQSLHYSSTLKMEATCSSEKSVNFLWPPRAIVHRIEILEWNFRREPAHSSLEVKVRIYKPEGHGFEALWSEILNLSNPSGSTKAWGLIRL